MKTKFSNVWGGKIWCDNFGTVRLSNPDLHAIGNIHEIYLKETFLGHAKIVAVRQFQYSHIRDVLAYLDSGMNAAKMAAMLNKMYGGYIKGGLQPQTLFDHIVFNWQKRDYQNQTQLMAEWYNNTIKQPSYEEFSNS